MRVPRLGIIAVFVIPILVFGFVSSFEFRVSNFSLINAPTIPAFDGTVMRGTKLRWGHFRTPLPPGHYKVSMKGRKSSIGHYGPFEVDVVPGKMTKVQWECDSGIR